MKNLIYLAIILIAVIVGYMYFFGKGEDRERAADVVQETKELGKSVGDFIKRQKERYDDGEFDRLMDKVSKTIDKIKSKTSGNTPEEKQELRELENQLRQIEPEKLDPDDRARLRKLLQELDEELK